MNEPPSSPPTFTLALPRKRSRARLASDLIPSSDPATFSGDDVNDASIEDYQNGRHKRMYRGPWWQQEQIDPPETKPRSRGGLVRNLDSGVWMGSDATDDSAVEEVQAALPKERASSQALAHAETEIGGQAITRTESTYVTSPAARDILKDVSGGEKQARSIICSNVESGRETFDLSGLSLTSLSSSTLRPIGSMIKAPPDNVGAPDPCCYRPMKPTVSLILSQNLLRSLPFEIWTFHNLTVLSLRNNKLASLPPAIAKLRNLVELNVAGNRLRWLPWDLLQLLGHDGHLRRLTVRPNPLFEGELCDRPVGRPPISFSPEEVDERPTFSSSLQSIDDHSGSEVNHYRMWFARLSHVFDQRRRKAWADDRDHTSSIRRLNPDSDPVADEEGGHGNSVHDEDNQSRHHRSLWEWKLDPVYITSTFPSFFGNDGRPIPGKDLPWSSTPDSTTLVPVPAPIRSSQPATRGHVFPPCTIAERTAPSLLELSLRSLAFSSSLPLHPDNLSSTVFPLSYLPETLSRYIYSAATARAENRRCGACNTNYVLPCAEWIDFWHYDPERLASSFQDGFLPFLRTGCGCGAQPIFEE